MARNEAKKENQFKEATLIEHLEELRWRLLYAILAWLIASSLAFVFRDRLLEWIKMPLASVKDVDLQVRNLTDPLMVVFAAAGFGGLALAMPVVVYQIWAFVAPGLTLQERRWGAPFLLGLGGSFAVGCVFAYYVILPSAINFMLTTFLPGVKVNLDIGAYVMQVVTYLATFGLLFELPITLFLLTKIGLVTPQLLASGRRIAIFGIVALSAIISPTVDPFNLALMSVPLIVLYEIGILLSKVAQRQNIRLSAQTG